MLSLILSHSSMILMVLLTLSELLAVVLPSNGGILAQVIVALKALGAKDVSGS